MNTPEVKKAFFLLTPRGCKMVGMITIEELTKRKDKAYEILKSCTLCPRRCKINRTAGQQGVCMAGMEVKVYSFMSHHGEEPILSGKFGSGAIFFSHCHMKCAYCQNYTFSQLGEGREVSDHRLAQMMLDLQAMKCHNINLVSPTHYVPQILAALCIAEGYGLAVPIVYNTGGYESVDTLRLLEGIVDIYLADARYGDNAIAKKYSSVKNYVEINQAAVLEMYRQVGPKGLIVRHLVLPGGLAGTDSVMKFIADRVSKEVYISLMSQYHPTYKAVDFPLINRRLSGKEYQKAVDAVINSGLKNGWFQPDMTGDVTERFIGTNFKSNV